MYLKAIIITSKISKAFMKEIEDFFESESLDFDDDLLNIEEIVREQDFYSIYIVLNKTKKG